MSAYCGYEAIDDTGGQPTLERCDDTPGWVVFVADRPDTALHVLVDGGEDMGMVPGLCLLCDEHRDFVLMHQPDKWFAKELPPPACKACGYREEGMSRSGYFSSRDQAHENLCCGSGGRCHWQDSKQTDYCATHRKEEPIEPKEEGTFISFGPVWNPDGTPTATTVAMLEGTGRLEEFTKGDK